MAIEIHTSTLRLLAPTLRAGDLIYLSGTVYTARDAAHKRIFSLIDEGKELPFEIKDSLIYYAGPTPARSGMVIGSCGPTTASRMDPYAPRLLDMGLLAMIGKGERSEEVRRAVIRNSALYLCAVGGAGALSSKCITSCEVIAFDDLGCESIKRLTFSRFPLYVGIDTEGNSIFKR
ncbi:MAG: fumarate hydratase C-terminal domain-containing protein [Clostridia bacterium]|nr:fumarate hydratase C-terminal domain-containing protein [Clostridia bacterium]